MDTVAVMLVERRLLIQERDSLYSLADGYQDLDSLQKVQIGDLKHQIWLKTQEIEEVTLREGLLGDGLDDCLKDKERLKKGRKWMYVLAGVAFGLGIFVGTQ